MEGRDKRDKARGEGNAQQMILLLDRCSVIHLCYCSLISSSSFPVETWVYIHTNTRTHSLVILEQPLCSFGQSSGCLSSPITVATELHPDSLQIGSVTLNTGAATHPKLHTHTHTQTSKQNVHTTHQNKFNFKDPKNTETHTHKRKEHLMNMVTRRTV